VPVDVEQMHPDDLKTVWTCRKCGRNFVFNSDAEDHEKQFNHSDMMLRDFLGGKKMAIFTRGRASLGFKVEGRMARAVVEYKYYPASDNISYTDVKYTDDRLRSLIEDNPQMMRNIDNYIRRLQHEGS